MKLRFVFSLLLSCLLLVIPVMSGTSYSQSQNAITEQKVLSIIDAADRASRKGNVAGMIAAFAKDVKIKMTFLTPASDKEQVLNLTKAQYASHTRRGMRRRLAYTLERKNTRVKIYAGGKDATITSDLYETLTIQQGTLRAATSEVAILGIRDGRIVITSIESRTRFY